MDFSQKPCVMATVPGRRFFKAFMTSAFRGAPPLARAFKLDRSYFSRDGCLARKIATGGTMTMTVTW